MTRSYRPKWNWSSPGLGGENRPIPKRDDERFLEVAHYAGISAEQHQEFGDKLWSTLNYCDHGRSRASANPPSPSEVLREFSEVDNSVAVAKQKIQSLSEVAKGYIIREGKRYSTTSIDEEGNPSLSSPLEKFGHVVTAISEIQNILSLCIQNVMGTVSPEQPPKENEQFLVSALIDLYLEFGGSAPSFADVLESDDTGEYGPCHRFIEEVSLVFGLDLSPDVISHRIQTWMSKSRRPE